MDLTVKNPPARYRSTLWLEAEKKALPSDMVPPSSWKAIYSQMMGQADDIIARLGSDALAPADFYQAWYDVISEGHARAWYAGRRLGGSDLPFSFGDRFVGQGAADADSYYLHRFMLAIQSGEYGMIDGEPLDADGLRTRMALYAKKTRGTANEALVNESGGYELFWTLGAAEHCPDCIALYQLNPWRPDEVHTNPGDGNTVCITNCKCSWLRSDGLRGFGPA
ncbi:MAG: hypothetical protein JNK63_10460 [Chthonomonas sp.]|nr:hypothetical protein [Chthonomonas sp.]